MATASRSAHVDTLPGVHLELNGTLHGNKTVLVVDAGFRCRRIRTIVEGTLSYFDTSGRLSTLGKVSGSFGPNEATDTPLGQLPNLSHLTLELSNHAGSVQLTLSSSVDEMNTGSRSRAAREAMRRRTGRDRWRSRSVRARTNTFSG